MHHANPMTRTNPTLCINPIQPADPLASASFSKEKPLTTPQKRSVPLDVEVFLNELLVEKAKWGLHHLPLPFLCILMRRLPSFITSSLGKCLCLSEYLLARNLPLEDHTPSNENSRKSF